MLRVKRLIFGAMVAAALGLAAGSRHEPTQTREPLDQAEANRPGPVLIMGPEAEALDAAG